MTSLRPVNAITPMIGDDRHRDEQLDQREAVRAPRAHCAGSGATIGIDQRGGRYARRRGRLDEPGYFVEDALGLVLQRHGHVDAMQVHHVGLRDDDMATPFALREVHVLVVRRRPPAKSRRRSAP